MVPSGGLDNVGLVQKDPKLPTTLSLCRIQQCLLFLKLSISLQVWAWVEDKISVSPFRGFLLLCFSFSIFSFAGQLQGFVLMGKDLHKNPKDSEIIQ